MGRLDQESQRWSHYPAWPSVVDAQLFESEETVCSYFPDRLAQMRGLATHRAAPDVYQAMMDSGFRRSGLYIYQPICRGCRDCQPIRVPVDEFIASTSQRRAVRKNVDIVVTFAEPELTDEKYELYSKYVSRWHKRINETDREALRGFLYESPVNTLEFTYRDATGQLLAVGICDVASESLSSVYLYFDPDHASRSLGVFSAVYEINWAKSFGIPYYYLGYYIPNCKTMKYKTEYQPCEIMATDGVWRRRTADPK